METKIDKQLLNLYQDFDYEELLWLAENPEDIETGTKLPDDGVMEEHLKVINYLIENYER